jgi:hypothetical protein
VSKAEGSCNFDNVASTVGHLAARKVVEGIELSAWFDELQKLFVVRVIETTRAVS